jgi:hypothetical protein
VVNINDAFPSAYLKASDLNGRRVAVTMSHADYEEVGRNKERRLVLYFDRSEKGMVLNKTNATTISKIYGTDTEQWSGHKITLYATDVEFGGEMVAAIRVATTAPGAPQHKFARNGPGASRNGGNGHAAATALQDDSQLDEAPLHNSVDTEAAQDGFGDDHIPF